MLAKMFCSVCQPLRWRDPLGSTLLESKWCFLVLIVINCLLGIPAFIETNMLWVSIIKSAVLVFVFVAAIYLLLRMHHKQCNFLKVTSGLFLVATIIGGGSMLGYGVFAGLSQLTELPILQVIFKWCGIAIAVILYLGYIVFAGNVWRHGLACGYFKGLLIALGLEALMMVTSYAMGWSFFSC